MLCSRHGGVTYLNQSTQRVTAANYLLDGRAVYGIADHTLTWQARLDHLRTALTANTEHARLGFIGHATHRAAGWDGMDSLGPPLPGPEAYEWRYNSHLIDEFVPDAHGLQLLTDRHLARAHDLSSWNIEPLGHGRHLLAAPDPAAWFSPGGPDPAALDRARHDFGDLILTQRSLDANPAPRP